MSKPARTEAELIAMARAELNVHADCSDGNASNQESARGGAVLLFSARRVASNDFAIALF
jgi:hypothetical protein